MKARAAFALAIAAAFSAACTTPAPAAPAGPPPPPPEKLATVLAELNDLCADTWCEGSYDFTFEKLDCTTALACTLSFGAKHDESGKATKATLALSGFDAILGADGTPTDSFENAVNDAIAEWETKQGS